MNKEKKDVSNIIAAIVGIISLVLSVINFVLGTYPYLNEKSDDMIAKEKAGHAESQLFLADYYYSVHDYANSVYWYRLLCNNTDNKYVATSYNNLACALMKNEDHLTYRFIKELFAILFSAENEYNYEIARNTARLLGYVGANDTGNSLYSSEYNRFFAMISISSFETKYKNEIDLLDASWKYIGEEVIGLSYKDYIDGGVSEEKQCFLVLIV